MQETGHILALNSAAWLQTLGRTHVLIVHFPIALLVVGAMIEFWRILRRKAGPSSAGITCIVLGALSAIMASAAGWIHRDFSTFGEESQTILAWHQWLGIVTASIAVLALLPLLFHRETRRVPARIYRTSAIIGAILVGVTGHLGGTLTHGSGYLTELLFAPAEESPSPTPVTPASLDVSAVHYPSDGKIDFIRDVQPILAHDCYQCHGPTKRSGSLRLDNKQSVFKGGKTGPEIVIGKSDDSLIIHRVLGMDNQKRMPVNAPPLSDEHVRILKSWIDQGANWPDNASFDGGVEEKHWAFVKPVHPEPPKMNDAKWVRNGIDNFVLARLEKEGLKPSPEADRATLIRRLYLDLVGLPPSPAEVDAFVADDRADAYDRLVNRLLASPHYGERWGRHWLDVARYADTNGYEKDLPRSIWPYRDWVIDALNRDMTFDQFVIQQMAGDMLPGATDDEKIATGFHRNTMFNEEGGIDVEEFRFKAIVDRVQTTSTAFLGLTMQCAQCHNHKYDPISQKEYYQFFSMLNNADEPDFAVPDQTIDVKRKTIQESIDKMESELESQFPAREEELVWEALKPEKASAKSGANLTVLPDDSVLASGAVADKDVYTVEFKADLKDVVAMKLEALPDPFLPKLGPGRFENGNFVVNELKMTRTSPGGSPAPIALTGATADFSQPSFEVAGLIDGKPETGWAVLMKDEEMHVIRTATVRLAKPPSAGETTITVTLDQNFPHHPLGRFRISAGRDETPPTTKPVEEERKQLLTQKQAEWEAATVARCAHWAVLDPKKFSRKYDATITKLDDHSLLFTGDSFYREEYDIECQTDLQGITAIKLEVLPHEELPKLGPGRGRTGGFQLSELNVSAWPADASAENGDEEPSALTLEAPTADAAVEKVAMAIDGKADTHWGIGAGEGTARTAVFHVKDAPAFDGATKLSFKLLQNYFESVGLGRVRLSVTTDKTDAQATGLSPEVEAALLVPADQRTAEQAASIRKAFLHTTPMLAAQQQKIKAARLSIPEYPTTLVMKERARPRVTNIHHRGEFLQLDEVVKPGVPAVLHPMSTGAKRDRIGLAMWLVDPENPLVARVTVNRIWSKYFGRGIVNTVDDFGTMGEKPSHPELLDWLVTEFVRQGWSMKAMHRLIVTSATYRQSSNVTPDLLEKDPANVLLARAPRLRVEGEIVRDVTLSIAGLLNDRIGGPSVFPPQPPGISEAAYSPFPWPTSDGPDRYRRGMYTHQKRTTPYPMLITFDGPTSDVTCTRRNRSNTPLQALTTLNDVVYVEAAQQMAKRIIEETPDHCDATERARYAMRLCVGRIPSDDEVKRVVAFHDAELKRFRDKQADASAVVQATAGADAPELAAWTLVCRSVLNLDETLTKD